MHRLSVVVLAALLAGAGCREAGHDSSAARPAPPPAAAPAGEEFCRDARTFVGNVVDLARTDWSEDRVRALYENVEAFLRRASELVPEHVRPSARRAATVLSAFRTALETVGYDLGRVDPAALATVSSPEFSAALGELADYSRRTCGLPG